MLEAQLSDYGIPVTICFADELKEAKIFVQKWDAVKFTKRIVICNENYTNKTEQAIKTVASYFHEKQRKMRFCLDIPYPIEVGMLYLIPFCDGQGGWIKELFKIIHAGSFAWIFSRANLNPAALPFKDFVTSFTWAEEKAQVQTDSASWEATDAAGE